MTGPETHGSLIVGRVFTEVCDSLQGTSRPPRLTRVDTRWFNPWFQVIKTLYIVGKVHKLCYHFTFSTNTFSNHLFIILLFFSFNNSSLLCLMFTRTINPTNIIINDPQSLYYPKSTVLLHDLCKENGVGREIYTRGGNRWNETRSPSTGIPDVAVRVRERPKPTQTGYSPWPVTVVPSSYSN